MKKLLLNFFLLSLTIVYQVAGQSLSADEEVILNKLVDQFMEKSKVPGMAVSIALNGKIIYSNGFGFADLEQEIAVTASTSKFRIASISKTLTADAIMQLVESGKLKLDDPVQRYVPSFPKKQWPLTTRLVAGHLGGIRHYRGGEFLSAKYYASVSQGLEIFKHDSLLFEPGTKYSYSSYGYNLISAVIEGASGMDYLTYMKINVFDRLELQNTVPDNNKVIIAHRSQFYQKSANGKIENAPYVDNSYKWAGGGFLSTSENLIKFMLAHTEPGYLSASSWLTLTTSQKTSDGKETGYGLGWATATDEQGYHWLGHSGGAVGGTSKMVYYPEKELIIIVLTNMSAARLGAFPHQLGWVFLEN